jgi:predicted Zn-dependent protease
MFDMRILRQSFLWIILILSAGLWVYKDITKRSTCSEPIKYTIGTVDSDFGLTAAEYKDTIEEATKVWEKATGKNLFEYTDKVKRNRFYEVIAKYFIRAEIPVSLIYDERQANTDKRNTLLTEVNQTKETSASLKAQITSFQSQYQQALAEYKTMQSDYRKRKVSYEALESKRLQVNSLADQTNEVVRKYNSLVGEINTTINTINKTGTTEFEEGLYVSDEKGERIMIYAFGDHTELVRVLAHELGHAIGLEHNDNPDSIMYYLNDSRVMSPSKEDLADLSAICKAR